MATVRLEGLQQLRNSFPPLCPDRQMLSCPLRFCPRPTLPYVNVAFAYPSWRYCCFPLSASCGLCATKPLYSERLSVRPKYSGTAESNITDSNACYHSVQNLLSSRLLSKNLKIRIYKTVILPVVLDGCEILSLTLREEHRLRVFKNRVLRRIFGPKRDEVTGE
jgi:hypothetical protein